jgi:hypothetical protein
MEMKQEARGMIMLVIMPLFMGALAKHVASCLVGHSEERVGSLL